MNPHLKKEERNKNMIMPANVAVKVKRKKSQLRKGGSYVHRVTQVASVSDKGEAEERSAREKRCCKRKGKERRRKREWRDGEH